MGVYKNVMELLVEEEVIHQFKALSPRVSAYVNQVEWVAHALNQLPPLYATSEKGLHYQLQTGRAKHGDEIKQAVHRALAAIRRDPIRTSVPLTPPHAPHQEVLSQLRFLLRNDQLEWETLPIAVEQALERASQGKILHQAPPPVRTPSVYAPVRGSSPFPQYRPIAPDVKLSALDGPPARRNTAKRIPSPPSADKSKELFGWDDPLYNSR